MFSPTGYEAVHYMILPAPHFLNTPSNNNFMINFSGVALMGFKGNQDGSWNRDTCSLSVSFMGIDIVTQRAQTIIGPPPPGAAYNFVPVQWTVLATVNSTFDKDNSVNAGFAADRFRIVTVPATATNQQHVNVLNGISVDVAVRDKDAILYRVGYSLDVYGFFVAIQNIIT